MKHLILSILVGLVCPAVARIGENRDQLIARYGTPLEDKPPHLAFEKNGLSVIMSLMDGTCQMMMISFLAKNPDGTSKAFTKDQWLALLEASGGKYNWTGDNGIFKTDDGKMTATLIEGSLLVIQTKAYHDKSEKESSQKSLEDDAKKAGLEGF